MYEYKAVPFLAHVSGREPKDAQKAAAQLTDAINAGVTGGWEFQQLASVYVEVKPGLSRGTGWDKVRQPLHRPARLPPREGGLSHARRLIGVLAALGVRFILSPASFGS